MAIDDLWYLRKKGPDGKRLLSTPRLGEALALPVRGRQRRAEVRMFERKVGTESWDAQARYGVAKETPIDHDERRTTSREYAERWRLSRQISQASGIDATWNRGFATTTTRTSATDRSGRSPSPTYWSGLPSWSRTTSRSRPRRPTFDVLNGIINAAAVDKVIPDNPCRAVRISAILRGFSRAPKWVPTTDEVLAMVEAVDPVPGCDLARRR
jgi:hypothetical protein